VPVELYNCDGSVGAALGAGIGAGVYKTAKEAFTQAKPLTVIEPTKKKEYKAVYEEWKELLDNMLD
jgi:xylulokinase